MKNIILILFLFPLYISGQISKPILSKLIDYSIEKTPAYCGYQVEYGVLKFELQENSENFKKGDVIFVVQKCPREIMEKSVGQYENNKIYNLYIGSVASKPFSENGYELCAKFYAKANPERFWYGNVKNIQ
jgi:hypothetical protein